MLGLGMASSHAPMMFQKASAWPRMLERIPAEAREHLPHSARVETASPAIVEGHIQRIEAAFATLRGVLQAYRPDALVMIGDDQGDMFDDANNPTFSIYTGDEPIWGRSARDPFGTPPPERTRVVFPQHAALARHLLAGLVERGFDVANIGRFDPRGNPARGVSHMVSNLVPEVDPGLGIPLVCVFLNEYYPPLPSAARCARLGATAPSGSRSTPRAASRTFPACTTRAGSTSPSTAGSSSGWRATRRPRSSTCSPSTPTPCARAPARFEPGSAWRRR
jgi:hypothetical protein